MSTDYHRSSSLTWQYPRVLVLLLVTSDGAVPDRVDHLLVTDGRVELELEEHRVLPPLRAMVLELGDGDGAVVELLRHPVPLGCKRRGKGLLGYVREITKKLITIDFISRRSCLVELYGHRVLKLCSSSGKRLSTDTAHKL